LVQAFLKKWWVESDFKITPKIKSADKNNNKKHVVLVVTYLLTLPLCAGLSRVRALSPAWTGSSAQETLISRTHLFLPHDLPPTKKIKYNKILTYILQSIFLEIPHLELLR
jgi:hypothetical protein